MRLGRGGPQGEDAIFMDLQQGLFAVADGSERASGASQRLTNRLARMAADFRGVGRALTRGSGDVTRVVERFKGAVESVLAAVPYGDATTLTALMVVRCPKETMGILCHSGDSLLYHYNPESGLRQISQTNFWMAGRSKKVYQAEAFPSPAGSVFLLATDGIWDLRFPGPSGMEGCLAESIQETPVAGVPGDLLARYDSGSGTVDDVALIAVRPEGLRRSREQIFVDVHGVCRRTLSLCS